jgi:hypothetical protein
VCAETMRIRKDTSVSVSSCSACVSGFEQVTETKTHLLQVVFVVDVQFLWYIHLVIPPNACVREKKLTVLGDRHD